MTYTIDSTTYDKAKTYPVYHGYATRPSAPTAIVVHSTEGVKGQTLQSAANYLYNSADVSADFLIGKAGEIIQFLDSRIFQAWHAGGQQSNGTWTAQPAYANPKSIGIECLHASGESWPAVQKDALAWLLTYLVQTYAIPSLAIDTHGQIAIAGPYQRKTDPTNWSHQEFIAWRDALFVQPKHYHVLGLPVYQRSDHTGPLWGHLAVGEQVVIDDPTNGHLADHRGFVDINGLALQP